MNSQTFRTPDQLQKADRRSAGADANNRKVFERTEFGRRRVLPLGVRPLIDLFFLVLGPFASLYQAIRRPNGRRKHAENNGNEG